MTTPLAIQTKLPRHSSALLLACGSLSSCAQSTAQTASEPESVEALVAKREVAPIQSGWTNFTASVDTRTVYVSDGSGSDSSDGLSSSTPKRTLAAARSLLRQGFPDWLLLKRGDVWHESLGQWKKSGRSASEPMLVSTYGTATARPLLETGALGGIWTNAGGGSPATIDNLALVGVHFHADGYSGGGDCIGAQFLQPGSHVLIEDCEFEDYSVNLVFQGYGGRHSDFRLRRSVVVDAYAIHSIGGHSQGLYAYAVDGLSIEENVFDHNGWNESVPGAGADIFSHNLYIDNGNTGVVVRGNIIANASSHGMQLRSGGSVVNNLFVRNSISLSVGGGNLPDPGGVTCDVRGNVILDGKDIDAANPRGWGMWFANIASGHVAQNVIANNTLGTQPSVITLDGQHVGDTGPSVGVHNLVIEKNIFCNWGGSILVRGDSAQITNVEFLDNDVQEVAHGEALIVHADAASAASVQLHRNRLFSALAPAGRLVQFEKNADSRSNAQPALDDSNSTGVRVSYSNPQRCVASCNAATGGPETYAAFVEQIRAQSHANWRPEFTSASVNAYLRGGFDLSFE